MTPQEKHLQLREKISGMIVESIHLGKYGTPNKLADQILDTISEAMPKKRNEHQDITKVNLSQLHGFNDCLSEIQSIKGTKNE